MPMLIPAAKVQLQREEIVQLIGVASLLLASSASSVTLFENEYWDPARAMNKFIPSDDGWIILDGDDRILL